MTRAAAGPVPSTLAGWYLWVTLTNQTDLRPPANAAMDGPAGDWPGAGLIVDTTLEALAPRKFGPDPAVRELTRFVVRGRQRYRPGTFVDFDLHSAETPLRSALGEEVCVAAMPKKLKHGTFLLANLIGKLALPREEYARVVVAAERTLLAAGHEFVMLEDSPLREATA